MHDYHFSHWSQSNLCSETKTFRRLAVEINDIHFLYLANGGIERKCPTACLMFTSSQQSLQTYSFEATRTHNIFHLAQLQRKSIMKKLLDDPLFFRNTRNFWNYTTQPKRAENTIRREYSRGLDASKTQISTQL
jgi:hypothetical protein